MPTRHQLSRTKGFRLPPGVVNVARPTKWGNPWVVIRDEQGRWQVTFEGRFVACFLNRQHAKEFAVALCRDRVSSLLKAYPDQLEPLRGKDLACWCKPGAACHADVLMEFANR